MKKEIHITDCSVETRITGPARLTPVGSSVFALFFTPWGLPYLQATEHKQCPVKPPRCLTAEADSEHIYRTGVLWEFPSKDRLPADHELNEQPIDCEGCSSQMPDYRLRLTSLTHPQSKRLLSPMCLALT